MLYRVSPLVSRNKTFRVQSSPKIAKGAKRPDQSPDTKDPAVDATSFSLSMFCRQGTEKGGLVTLPAKAKP